MELDELKKQLKDIADSDKHFPMSDHMDADLLLLKYINDDEVSDLFSNIEKWYA